MKCVILVKRFGEAWVGYDAFYHCYGCNYKYLKVEGGEGGVGDSNIMF